MAFDSARGRAVLFGVFASDSSMNDTWEWDGLDWTRIQDIGPPPRSLTAMDFDSTRGRTVLFGGAGSGGVLLGDIWEWEGSEWTQVQDVGPSARSGHTMAFDSNQQRRVLFGGRASGGLTGDTWQWDGTAWTQVEDTGPPVRELHVMVYAADRNRTVLFGGDGGSGTGHSDTMEWEATQRTHAQNVGPARERSAMGTQELARPCSTGRAARRSLRRHCSAIPGSGTASDGWSARTWVFGRAGCMPWPPTQRIGLALWVWVSPRIVERVRSATLASREQQVAKTPDSAVSAGH